MHVYFFQNIISKAMGHIQRKIFNLSLPTCIVLLFFCFSNPNPPGSQVLVNWDSPPCFWLHPQMDVTVCIFQYVKGTCLYPTLVPFGRLWFCWGNTCWVVVKLSVEQLRLVKRLLKSFIPKIREVMKIYRWRFVHATLVRRTRKGSA